MMHTRRYSGVLRCLWRARFSSWWSRRSEEAGRAAARPASKADAAPRTVSTPSLQSATEPYSKTESILLRDYFSVCTNEDYLRGNEAAERFSSEEAASPVGTAVPGVAVRGVSSQVHMASRLPIVQDEMAKGIGRWIVNDVEQQLLAGYRVDELKADGRESAYSAKNQIRIVEICAGRFAGGAASVAGGVLDALEHDSPELYAATQYTVLYPSCTGGPAQYEEDHRDVQEEHSRAFRIHHESLEDAQEVLDSPLTYVIHTGLCNLLPRDKVIIRGGADQIRAGEGNAPDVTAREASGGIEINSVWSEEGRGASALETLVERTENHNPHHVETPLVVHLREKYRSLQDERIANALRVFSESGALAQPAARGRFPEWVSSLLSSMVSKEDEIVFVPTVALDCISAAQRITPNARHIVAEIADLPDNPIHPTPSSPLVYDAVTMRRFSSYLTPRVSMRWLFPGDLRLWKFLFRGARIAEYGGKEFLDEFGDRSDRDDTGAATTRILVASPSESAST